MIIIVRYLFLEKICEYLNVDVDDYEFNGYEFDDDDYGNYNYYCVYDY